MYQKVSIITPEPYYTNDFASDFKEELERTLKSRTWIMSRHEMCMFETVINSWLLGRLHYADTRAEPVYMHNLMIEVDDKIHDNLVYVFGELYVQNPTTEEEYKIPGTFRRLFATVEKDWDDMNQINLRLKFQ